MRAAGILLFILATGALGAQEEDFRILIAGGQEKTALLRIGEGISFRLRLECYDPGVV